MKRGPKAFLSVALFGTAAGLGGWWLFFRATHVVAAYAFVKGGVVQVGAPVDGQVVSVEVEPGQRVKAGDVLVRFNDARERAALHHARASWEEAKLQVAVEKAHVRVLYAAANVTSTQVMARIEVSEAEAQVASIDAELALARAQRTSQLRQQDVVPEEESEVSEAASLIARGKAEQAERRVRAARAQLGTARLQHAQAKAREARLELLQAKCARPRRR
jgi:membrane fusion protein (multidrug efflux system)